MIANENKLVREAQGTEACWQSNLRCLVNDTVIECPSREQRADSCHQYKNVFAVGEMVLLTGQW